ncbi:MAG: mechanosensitive ion channel family protein [Oscillibacter sp.]|nr:mechanosensitive ion channel family protein [Oscillibacter sp.]
MGTMSTSILDTSIGGYSLARLLTAGVTLVVCLLIIRVIMKILKRLLAKTSLDKRVQGLIANILKYAMYVLTVIIVAQGLGVNMSSFVALLSVLSLGITLAAEDILGNFAGGLVIFSTHPFAIGDFIESSGTTGAVEEIDLHHTKLLSPDGYHIFVPNKDLAASRIINYTALGRRRVTVKVTASYDAPTETVMSALRTAVARTENIMADPAPGYWLTGYGASSIEYTIFCWTQAANYWTVLCNLNAALRPAFEEAGVEMTYDHLNVHLVHDGADKVELNKPKA